MIFKNLINHLIFKISFFGFNILDIFIFSSPNLTDHSNFIISSIYIIEIIFNSMARSHECAVISDYT